MKKILKKKIKKVSLLSKHRALLKENKDLGNHIYERDKMLREAEENLKIARRQATNLRSLFLRFTITAEETNRSCQLYVKLMEEIRIAIAEVRGV